MSDDLHAVGPTDRDVLADAIAAQGPALGELLHVSGPGRGGAPVPGLEWTVAETAAHVLTVVRRALGDRRRSATALETDELNAAALREITLREPVTLGMELDRDIEVVARRVLAQVRDGDALIPFHAGLRVRALDAFGALLAELVVHGQDLARGLGVEHPVPPAHAALALRSTVAVCHGWLDPDRTGGDHGFRLDVAGLPAVLRVDVTDDGLLARWCPDEPRGPEPLEPLATLLEVTRRSPPTGDDVAGLVGVLLPM